MSAYSDAMNDKLVKEVEKKFVDKMEWQLTNTLLNKNKWKIILICLILILIYCSTFFVLFSQMKNIHSKHEYLVENLKNEREKLNQFKENLFELKEAARNNLDKSGQDCYECWYSFLRLDDNSIHSYIKLINQPIKRSYYETLSLAQKLLIGLSYGNIHLMMVIYIKPFRLIFVSVLLYIINLCIYGRLFIGDTPSVYYTLVIGTCIFLFSIFLLFKIVIDLLMIDSYQKMKKILQSK